MMRDRRPQKEMQKGNLAEENGKRTSSKEATAKIMKGA